MPMRVLISITLCSSGITLSLMSPPRLPCARLSPPATVAVLSDACSSLPLLRGLLRPRLTRLPRELLLPRALPLPRLLPLARLLLVRECPSLVHDTLDSESLTLHNGSPTMSTWVRRQPRSHTALNENAYSPEALMLSSSLRFARGTFDDGVQAALLEDPTLANTAKSKFAAAARCAAVRDAREAPSGAELQLPEQGSMETEWGCARGGWEVGSAGLDGRSPAGVTAVGAEDATTCCGMLNSPD